MDPVIARLCESQAYDAGYKKGLQYVADVLENSQKTLADNNQLILDAVHCFREFMQVSNAYICTLREKLDRSASME